MSNDVIPCDITVDESVIRPIQAQAVPYNIMEHRQSKINELKEVIGNRDFTQGGTMSGVTAYSAITALQETGSKLSRDVLKSSYRAFHDVVYLCVELIRQFYSDSRMFRILGKDGQQKYVAFDNKNLVGSGLNSSVFDIRIIPQRKNPFSTATHNQLILDLYKLGAFAPQTAKSAQAAVDAMIIDNKDEIVDKLRNIADEYQSELQSEQELMMQYNEGK